ncbi:MAG: threonine/serine exporter family protein [Clostridia bacterium]|nr:threonine/serine exporter family protein [Clostridia bacterium]
MGDIRLLAYRFALTVMGVLLFALLDRARTRVVIAACICGAVTFVVGDILETMWGAGFVSYFFSASVTCVCSELGARVLKVPATVILLPAIIPLVPGSLLYSTMRALMAGNAEWYSDYGSEALSATCGIGIAIVSTSAAVKLFWAMGKRVYLYVADLINNKQV